MEPKQGSLGASTILAVTWRLVPFMTLLYFINYLDRVNVGFAALTMNADLGFSATVYGLGAGVFFVGYVLFEVPSNILLHKIGARIWIARIMLTWGLISGAMAFVTGPTSFYIVRFLLGVAEAGFVPGMILYLTYWFPASARVKVTGLFMVAIPLSAAIGAPISSVLLGIDWLGLKGWQWMFILEAIPAVILSIVVFFYLTDRPADARWLSAEQRDWLTRTMDEERAAIRSDYGRETLGHALRDLRVLGFGLVYFAICTGSYALGFWLPQIVKSFGSLTTIEIGLVTGLVNVFGAIAMVVWAHRSDARKERIKHFVVAMTTAAVAYAAFAFVQTTPVLAVVALTFAAMGVFASLPPFWALPTSFLSGMGAAGGIAMIISLGNVAGYVCPFAIGYLKDATGGFSASVLCIAALLVIGAALAVILVRASSSTTERAPLGQGRPAV